MKTDIPKKLGIDETDFRLVIGSSTVDYDLGKNEINKLKHGYSFEEAIAIFEKVILPISSSPPIAVKDSIEKNGEIRSNIITLDKHGRVVVIALTMRPSETVRIISMRSSSQKERKIFSEITGYNESVQPIVQKAGSG